MCYVYLLHVLHNSVVLLKKERKKERKNGGQRLNYKEVLGPYRQQVSDVTRLFLHWQLALPFLVCCKDCNNDNDKHYGAAHPSANYGRRVGGCGRRTLGST